MKAIEAQPSELSHRIVAAKDFRAAKRIDLAKEQLELALNTDNISDSVKAKSFQEMFRLYLDEKDPIAAFCAGEAALQLGPTDFDFRFGLACAYADATGGSAAHDYSDLALFHYSVIVRIGAQVEYAENNLGVLCHRLGAPIRAVEHYKASSTKGNPLATANVLRQYLGAGFVSEAEAWAEQRAPKSDNEGHVSQALATIHTFKSAEKDKIAAVLRNEISQRLYPLLERWIPFPRVLHPYPHARFAAGHPR